MYDKVDIEYNEGPVAVKVKYNKEVTITYRSVGDGLKAEGDKIIGFKSIQKVCGWTLKM